ncbi:MAG TPA: hypothetical protein VJH70_00520 [Candidatus Paceibacterota bacterium]
MQNQMSSSNPKKWIWIGLGIIIVGLLVWWFGSGSITQSPEINQLVSPAEDSTATIEQQLNDATDFGAIEDELKTTEADLNSL